MSLPPVRTGMTGGCHYARPLTLCSGLISGAVIKMLPQITTEGKRRLLGLQLQVVIYPSGEITVAGLQEAGHISSQGQKETDARMASCLLGSAPFLYSYTVQEFLLREWCCPHWAGIFPYQLTQDNAQQTCSLTGQPSRDTETFFSADSSLCQVDKLTINLSSLWPITPRFLLHP